ncbi:MAG: Clp protease N-terminal domain-containing protein, partial [Rhodopirellula bahusiensis]
MAFRIDKLTTQAQNVVAEAQAQATSAGNAEIDPLHVLSAAVNQRDGI